MLFQQTNGIELHSEVKNPWAARKQTAFLDWCQNNDIIIDDRLAIVVDNNGQVSVHSNGPDIEPFTSVAQIPKNAVLSVKSSGIHELQKMDVVGREAQLALALALYIEMEKREFSPWHGYLQSLPTEVVDIPIFWPPDDEAIRLYRHTEIERILNARDGSGLTMLEALHSFYERTVVSVAKIYLNCEPSFKDFAHAFSLVSSRAFLVDAYHGLSMVPIADAFNHSQENHVHLESEYDVCPECGALQQCPHDSPPPESEFGIDSTPEPTYFEMVTNTVVPPGEVFNTYGEDLSNAELLVRYGFMSDVNENDRVSWEIPVDAHRGVQSDLDLSTLEEAELVHIHEGSKPEWYINSDGILSHSLFLHIAGHLEQQEVDALLEPGNLAYKGIAARVVEWCEQRKNQLADVGHIDLDHASSHVKWVTLQIISEVAILEGGISRWSDD